MSKMLSKVRARISSEKLDNLKLVEHRKAIMLSPFPQSICPLQQICQGLKGGSSFFCRLLRDYKINERINVLQFAVDEATVIFVTLSDRAK